MAYDIYPAVDPDYNFPPEIRTALAKSSEFKTLFDDRPTYSALATRGILKKFATIADMIADTALTDGDVAVISRYSLGTNMYHNSSTWQRTNGVWTPVGNIVILEATSGPTTKAAAQVIVSQVLAGGGKIAMPYTRFKNNNINGPFEWVWNGGILEPRTGFLHLRSWSQWNWGPMLNGAWTDPPLDSWQDPYGVAWANTNGFVAPATGKYRISGRIAFQQNMDGARVIISFMDSNGGEVWAGIPPYMYSQVGAVFTLILDCVATVGYKYRIFKDGTTTVYFTNGNGNTGRNAYTNEYTVEFLGSGL